MKKNLIALGLLIVLAVAALLVFREPAPAEESAAGPAPALAPVAAAKIDTLRVRRHEGSGSSLREEEILLVRDGELWRMKEPVDYAVQPESVERMVEVLDGLVLVDLISENPAKHQVLEVDDALGIEVEAQGGGQPLAHLIIGVSRDNMTYVRKPGADAVYRIQGSHRTAFNRSAKNLRDKQVTGLEKGSVKRMRFVNEYGELVIVREGEGESASWRPEGQEIQNFDAAKAGNIAVSLANLSCRDFVDEPLGEDATGLGEGAARIDFVAAGPDGDRELTMWIGNDLEKERQTYLKTSLSDQLFLVSTHMVQRYRAKADDFARTDEQLAAEAEQRAKADEHRRQHEAAAEGAVPGMPPAMAGQPGQGQIPPEMMEKIRAQMKQQGGGGHEGH